MVIEKNEAKSVGLDKIGWAGLILGLIGVGIVGGQAITSSGADKAVSLSAYMFGFAFWFTLTIGCLGLVFLHHTVRGAWGLSIMRLIEAGGGAPTLAAFGVLCAPIFMNLKSIYKWTDTAYMNETIMMKAKLFYLNEQGFMIRVVVCFLIWIAYAWYFRQSTLKQDATGDDKLRQKRTSWSAPGLVVFVVTVTLATVDLFMSLDPAWMSQIWGFLFIVYGGLAALALCNLIVMSNATKEPFNRIINSGLSKDLGNWMFVFTCLWAYFSYSQYVIIYAGNLPEFNTYFVDRFKPGWMNLFMALIVGQFLVPFLLLLIPKVKKSPNLLVAVAVWILAFRVVDLYWVLMPFMRKEFAPHMMDAVAFIGMGGIWFFFFSQQLQKARLIPTHDPRVITAYEHA